MTRPSPGVSFAQFFPNAPKVRAEVEGRADRERSRRNSIQGNNSSCQDSAVGAPTSSITGSAPPSQANAISSDAVHSHTDDHDTPLGDIPNTVGSASSHTSSASSVFSNSQRQTAAATSSHISARTTPLPHRDSSSYSPNPSSAKPDMPPLDAADHGSGRTHIVAPTQTHNGVDTHGIQHVDRPSARDPFPSVKGLKCTYDPILDRARNKGAGKGSKPSYKEFGLVRIHLYSLG
jgi:histone-lysine N-methyltransferase SETD1